MVVQGHSGVAKETVRIALSANDRRTFQRLDGGTSTSLYVKTAQPQASTPK